MRVLLTFHASSPPSVPPSSSNLLLVPTHFQARPALYVPAAPPACLACWIGRSDHLSSGNGNELVISFLFFGRRRRRRRNSPPANGKLQCSTYAVDRQSCMLANRHGKVKERRSIYVVLENEGEELVRSICKRRTLGFKLQPQLLSPSPRGFINAQPIN